MNSGEAPKPWPELPKSLQGLPRRRFVRRPPETHEESLQPDVFYDVKDLGELLERLDKRPLPPTKK